MKIMIFRMMFLVGTLLALSFGGVAQADLWGKLKSNAENMVRGTVSNMASDSGEKDSSAQQSMKEDQASKGNPESTRSNKTQSSVTEQSKPLQTAELTGQSSNASPVKAPDIDILGVRIGMTGNEARGILEAQGYVFGAAPGVSGPASQSLSISSILGTREIPDSKRLIRESAQNKSGDAQSDVININYAMAPNDTTIISLDRNVSYGALGPDKDKTISAIKSKYGEPTFMVLGNNSFIPSSYFWLFGQDSQLLSIDKSTIPHTQIMRAGGALCGSFFTPFTFPSNNEEIDNLVNLLDKKKCSAELTAIVSGGAGRPLEVKFTLQGNSFAHAAFTQTKTLLDAEIQKDNDKADAQVRQRSAPSL